jgi:hypothetical protein
LVRHFKVYFLAGATKCVSRPVPQFKVNEFEQFPIPALDLSIKADKARHDNLVSLVDKTLELKQKEAAEPNPQVKTSVL